MGNIEIGFVEIGLIIFACVVFMVCTIAALYDISNANKPKPKQIVNGYDMWGDYRKLKAKTLISIKNNRSGWTIEDYETYKGKHPNPQQHKINNTQHEMD